MKCDFSRISVNVAVTIPPPQGLPQPYPQHTLQVFLVLPLAELPSNPSSFSQVSSESEAYKLGPLCLSPSLRAPGNSIPGLTFGHQEETWIGLPFTKIHLGFLHICKLISYQWKTNQFLALTNLCRWVNIVLPEPRENLSLQLLPESQLSIKNLQLRPSEDRDDQDIHADGPQTMHLAISSWGESNETYGSSPQKCTHRHQNFTYNLEVWRQTCSLNL